VTGSGVRVEEAAGCLYFLHTEVFIAWQGSIPAPCFLIFFLFVTYEVMI
jgi:hypothetical protein